MSMSNNDKTVNAKHAVKSMKATEESIKRAAHAKKEVFDVEDITIDEMLEELASQYAKEEAAKESSEKMQMEIDAEASMRKAERERAIKARRERERALRAMEERAKKNSNNKNKRQNDEELSIDDVFAALNGNQQPKKKEKAKKSKLNASAPSIAERTKNKSKPSEKAKKSAKKIVPPVQFKKTGSQEAVSATAGSKSSESPVPAFGSRMATEIAPPAFLTRGSRITQDPKPVSTQTVPSNILDDEDDFHNAAYRYVQDVIKKTTGGMNPVNVPVPSVDPNGITNRISGEQVSQRLSNSRAANSFDTSLYGADDYRDYSDDIRRSDMEDALNSLYSNDDPSDGFDEPAYAPRYSEGIADSRRYGREEGDFQDSSNTGFDDNGYQSYRDSRSDGYNGNRRSATRSSIRSSARAPRFSQREMYYTDDEDYLEPYADYGYDDGGIISKAKSFLNKRTLIIACAIALAFAVVFGGISIIDKTAPKMLDWQVVSTYPVSASLAEGTASVEPNTSIEYVYDLTEGDEPYVEEMHAVAEYSVLFMDKREDLADKNDGNLKASIGELGNVVMSNGSFDNITKRLVVHMVPELKNLDFDEGEDLEEDAADDSTDNAEDEEWI